jgi:hypothetical protein
MLTQSHETVVSALVWWDRNEAVAPCRPPLGTLIAAARSTSEVLNSLPPHTHWPPTRKGQRQESTAGGGIVPAVGRKADRRAASERVAAYHEARLGELIEYIAAAIDRYRAGEIDAYTVDETIHHYHRASGPRQQRYQSSSGSDDPRCV